MNRMLAPALALTASPALAHSGTHLHPHGADNALMIALALGLGAVVALIMVRK